MQHSNLAAEHGYTIGKNIKKRRMSHTFDAKMLPKVHFRGEADKGDYGAG